MVVKFRFMPELAPEENRIFMEQVEIEMRTWLDDNVEEENYYIAENKVCIKHVFMPSPGNQNEYATRGYYILFTDPEDAMAFKLRWA